MGRIVSHSESSPYQGHLSGHKVELITQLLTHIDRYHKSLRLYMVFSDMYRGTCSIISSHQL
jgi:hypothetical protein